ncbi:hypothetical protein [Vibrio atypicus]|uniref:hypothetical protein n=1 Tax=Vibrio atypicus TaxID=558271 RepID=UPI003735A3BF
MFSIQLANIDDLTSLMRQILSSVREERVTVLPKEKYALLARADDLFQHVSISKKVDQTALSEALAIIERLALVVNLERFSHFGRDIERASQIINTLQTVLEAPKTQNDASIERLTEYLLYQRIIDCPSTIQTGNSIPITKAYLAGMLNFSEAVEAVEALVACKKKLQLIQLDASRTTATKSIAA